MASTSATAGPQNARSVYLITYSQANLEIVPDRRDFAMMVKDAFEKTGSGTTVLQRWCCCKEEHKDGNPHYHLAVKLNMQRRWASVRNYLAKRYKIHINFSDGPGNYYEAWKYCTKSDTEVLLSDDHPDFTNAPRTTAATTQKVVKQNLSRLTEREERLLMHWTSIMSLLKTILKLKKSCYVLLAGKWKMEDVMSHCMF